MILSDRDIKSRLKNDLIIKPLNLEEQLGPSSIDLRLDDEFLTFKLSDHSLIDPKDYKDKEIFRRETKNTIIIENVYTRKFIMKKSFIIHPGEFVLASIIEYVEIPHNLVGVVEGRSSIGRLGIMIHVTAGYIDPGFCGKITLEIANVGKIPVKLYPKMRICQLVLHNLSSYCDIPYHKKKRSKYQNQKGSQHSKISEDFE
ncbi:MAG: dCTP deaminase [Candidatus Aenigmarchaeota archaeon ex4484_52]|nr:MAG: dCTP deaminase [Candidatus Aenigmarchaeota archaeon ex4484_52]